MTDPVPYWLVDPPEGRYIVPWSGEVIPIDVPPVPVDVPVAGPVIHFIGEGEHAVWNDVWGWIKGGASSVVSTYDQLATAVITDVVHIVESYTGEHLAAISGFINRTFDYAQAGLDAINFWTADAISIAFGDIQGITAGLTELENIVAAIDGTVIPGVFAELSGLIEGVYGDLVGGIDLVKSWAIDTIYTPLDTEIRNVEATIPVWAEGALTDAKAYADQLVHSEALQRAAAIAGIAAAVSALVAESETCTQPMCDTFGPKTDLGKLLKGLQLALAAGALAEIANAKESDVADAITRVASHLATVINTFETQFVTGGGTAAELVAAELGNLI